MLAVEQSVTRHDSGAHAAARDPRPTLTVVPFEPWHLLWMTLQPSQQILATTLTVEHGESLRQAGPCYTGLAGATVVACAGIMEFWPGRAQAWALLSEEFPSYIKDIHRAVRAFLETYTVARLECVVDPQYPETLRWAEHLGFTHETSMPNYTPQGETRLMYVRLH